MDDMKLLSTEAEGVNEAIAEEHRKALVNGAGRVGALLGLQSPQNGSSAAAADAEDSTGAPSIACDLLLCRRDVWHASVVPHPTPGHSQPMKGRGLLHGIAVHCPDHTSVKEGFEISPQEAQAVMPAETMPEGLRKADCPAGVPERIPDMPLTEVKLVNIKLLTLAELKLITDRGAEGRRRLSEVFAGPERLVSSLHRASAV